jgi:hypothetical protein
MLRSFEYRQQSRFMGPTLTKVNVATISNLPQQNADEFSWSHQTNTTDLCLHHYYHEEGLAQGKFLVD